MNKESAKSTSAKDRVCLGEIKKLLKIKVKEKSNSKKAMLFFGEKPMVFAKNIALKTSNRFEKNKLAANKASKDIPERLNKANSKKE